MGWDEPGGGRAIAEIAEIGGIARYRKTKTLPRIDADERGSGMGLEP
jgi:hypothetical protein